MNSFKERWNSLTPEHKKKVVLLSLISGIVLVSIVGYLIRGSDTTQKVSKEPEKRDITIDPTLLQKTQLQESQKEIERLKQEIEDLKKLKEETLTQEKTEQYTPPLPPQSPTQTDTVTPPPLPPLPTGSSVPPPPVIIEKSNTQPQETQPLFIGGISVVSQNIQEVQEKAEDSKKKTTIYLPPSFMEATLLSGLDAPAVGKGEGHPVPVLLRVKTPAILPNKVKANLKGCFVIAEGLGSLATERAELRLVSLSCIDKAGRAIIDQKIKGFVVDSDGKIGLRGRVVSKMGSVLARSFLAGLFSGIGQSASQVSSQQAMSYGVTDTTIQPRIDLNQIGISALGQGVASAAGELQKFYLELARQTIPVIEVLATRNVTLVVSEGVELEIKEYSI